MRHPFHNCLPLHADPCCNPCSASATSSPLLCCVAGSLNDVLKRARSSPLLAAQLDWARRLNMALDAAKGMLYLHSCSPPIIHRCLCAGGGRWGVQAEEGRQGLFQNLQRLPGAARQPASSVPLSDRHPAACPALPCCTCPQGPQVCQPAGGQALAGAGVRLQPEPRDGGPGGAVQRGGHQPALAGTRDPVGQGIHLQLRCLRLWVGEGGRQAGRGWVGGWGDACARRIRWLAGAAREPGR